MPVRLSVYAVAGPVSVHRLQEGREYVVGRGEDTDVRVDDERVSRRHARLAPDGDGAWVVTDLDSKNGLLVEGERVGERRLTGEAWLSFGGVVARFDPLPAAAGGNGLDGESEELERRRAGARLQRTLDPADGLGPLLDRLLDSVISMADAERGFLLLTQEDGDHRIVRVAGLAAEELGEAEFEGSVGAVEQALATRRPVVCCDARVDHVLGERPSVMSSGIRALVCLPLSALDRVLGVVYADSHDPGRDLTELDLEILEGLADHAALGLAVHDLTREVEGLGSHLGAGREPQASGSWRLLTAVHRLPPREDAE